jgi:sulfite reductase (NADPH) hemoprotein beta-component
VYRYDEIDQRLVDERVTQFRDQTRRFLAGGLSEDDFRPLRLRNGLYIQRYAPMLRVAIPYGLLTSRQLRTLAHIARRWDRGYGHFSTRQNIQFNWPKLEDVPEILAELAQVQMHAIQTSGNSVRNITTDHFAGVAHDEIVDSFVWCELLRQWSTLHPEFSFLPRKFKIAVNGAAADRAAIFLHDIGLQAVRDKGVTGSDGASPGGEVGFRVIVGGGMGRTPIIGHVMQEFLPWRLLLTYLEAVMRVYNRYGRRDNLNKAPIKILVKERTPERFREEVDAEWAHLKDGPSTLTEEEVRRVEGRFTRPAYEQLPGDDPGHAARLAAEPAFAAWAKRNVHPHKVPGYAALTLSLKKTGVPPGDATADQMDAVAGFATATASASCGFPTSRTYPRRCAPIRIACALGRGQGAGTGDPQHRADHQHHRLPGRRLLLARQRQVDPGRGSHPAPVRRPGLPARHRRAGPEHFRLHERLRSPSRRPHRDSRGR